MAQVPEVYKDFVGDGSTRIYGFAFPYLTKSEVFVSVDDVDVLYVWLNGSGSSIELTEAPAEGAAIRIYRSTAAVKTRHEFDGGVPFLPRYVDENNQQLLYVAQEAIATSSEANVRSVENTALSDLAVQTADAATAIATAASAAAMDAVDVAGQALAASATAVATADDAAAVAGGIAETAGTALSVAEAAEAIAIEALETASEAGVASFKGRNGIVVPEAGDYNAEQITRGTGTVETALAAAEAALSNKINPPPADGVTYAFKDGVWVPSVSGDPVLSPGWAIHRNNIGDGYAAQDGQLLSRATYPDAWAQAQAVGMVITEAEWQADPLKRGFFSDGDGSTTFRIPDANGKQPGSLGAVFLRGDGALSAGQAGLIQRDAYQGHKVVTPGSSGEAGGANFNPQFGTTEGTLSALGLYSNTDNGRYALLSGNHVSDGSSGDPRTASETRALNLTVVWTIKLFGAVVNVGSADAAQLASDYANLAGRVSALESIGKPLTKEFVSAPQAITLGGTVTVAHDLGVKPKLIRLVAICTTADGAYVVGSERELAPYIEYTAQGIGCEAESSDTQIVVRFGSTAVFPIRSGATVAYATASRWQLRVEAMA